MLRSLLIYLSKAAWARSLVTRWKFAWRAASRFVAGEKLEDAIRTIQALNARGINVDHLGEHTTTPDESRLAVGATCAFDAIQESGSANVSNKLTQIGLQLGEELCVENCERFGCQIEGNFVRADMDD
jgi:proline dehydrogenase